jgi:hypothetical protein
LKEKDFMGEEGTLLLKGFVDGDEGVGQFS